MAYIRCFRLLIWLSISLSNGYTCMGFLPTNIRVWVFSQQIYVHGYPTATRDAKRHNLRLKVRTVTFLRILNVLTLLVLKLSWTGVLGRRTTKQSLVACKLPAPFIIVTRAHSKNGSS